MSAIPVRVSFSSGTIRTLWRRCTTLEHGELCRLFSLDPVRTSFDLPRAATGDTFVGAGGNARRGNISGYVKFDGEVIGTIFVAKEGERFRDLDPTSEADRLCLNQAR